MNLKNHITTGFLALALAQASNAQTAKLTIDVNKPGAKVSPVMHGVFFEDINYGADGGLYAELVQNRSFEHNEHLYAWSTVNRGAAGKMAVADSAPLNARNTRYTRLQIEQAGQGFGIANSGYGGIAVKTGDKYLFAVHARGTDYKGGLRAILEDEKGASLGEFRIKKLSANWARYEGAIRSKATTANARLVVLADGAGQVDLDVVSLFPELTFNKRRNGMRADLVQLLADMKPGFMRFPGGCIVEGKVLSNAYRWKDTIGDVSTRPQNWNRWNEWQAPQYYQTYGLGFFEYFQLCEDIGAEPVPILNCGMACQFQSGETVPLAELGPFVQDTLDLIEFANGPVTSKWGKVRAQMGHPKPFNMKYLGVGNEQWAAPYFERYPIFYKALKARYPGITLITTAGPGVDDNHWRYAWDQFKSGTPAEIVDEHYYRAPSWFLTNDRRYDNYDRKGPKVFAGEYASHTNGKRNNLEAAISEAAFITGLVRNADVVHMASYAPLFAKIGSTQWTPDLIWFDNTGIYGSPSYYVQQMYGRNRPDHVLPLQLEAAQQVQPFKGGIGVGTWNTQAEFKDIEVSQDGKTLWRADLNAGLNGWEKHNGEWRVEGGALRQSAEAQDVAYFVGDPNWSDYTLTLNARKLAGKEGFMIYFGRGAGGGGVWNIGGWNNTLHGLDLTGNPAQVPGKIETNRWYDIRVELKGNTIKAFLDGQLVQQGTRPSVTALYAVAGRDLKTGETIVDVVNPTSQPMQASLNLNGITRVTSAKAIVLTGAPGDENSMENPTKVIPREMMLMPSSGPNFAHSFPANSFTVLRLKTQ